LVLQRNDGATTGCFLSSTIRARAAACSAPAWLVTTFVWLSFFDTAGLTMYWIRICASQA